MSRVIVLIWQNLPSIFVTLIILSFSSWLVHEIYKDRKQNKLANIEKEKQKMITEIKAELSSQIEEKTKEGLLSEIRKEEKEQQQLEWDMQHKKEQIRKLKIMLESKYGSDPEYEKVTIAIPKDTENISFSSYSGGYTHTSMPVKKIKEELGTDPITDSTITVESSENEEYDDELPYF